MSGALSHAVRDKKGWREGGREGGEGRGGEAEVKEAVAQVISRRNVNHETLHKRLPADVRVQQVGALAKLNHALEAQPYRDDLTEAEPHRFPDLQHLVPYVEGKPFLLWDDDDEIPDPV